MRIEQNRPVVALALVLWMMLTPHAVGAVISPTGQPIDEAPTGLFVAAISGDGRWVVFEGNRQLGPGIRLWDSVTSTETSIDVAGHSPAVSDDGRWIAYIRESQDGAEAFLWDRNSRRSVQLSSGVVESSSPSISDDGSVVIWADAALPQGRTTVQIWERSTGASREIDYNTGVPVLSGNGRYVFRNIAQNTETRFDLRTGLQEELAFEVASVSDDGTTVAYRFPRFGSADRHGVGILQIDTNVSVELETSPNTARFPMTPHALVLSGDGSTLFFNTAASLVVRDDDAQPSDFGQPDTYRWVPGEGSLDFTDRPDDLVISSSDSGREVLAVGREFADRVETLYVRYSYPPPLTTPALVDIEDINRPQLTDQVHRLYEAFFLRSPDSDGLRFWRDQRSEGSTVGQIADSFVASPEFIDRYGELSNVEFVELIYRNLFDRLPDSDGRAFWTAELSNGRSRGSVMVQFSESPEYVRLTGTSAPQPPAAQQLWRLYRAYLGRDPDQGGFDFWYTQLANDATLLSVSNEFARSAEFVRTYGDLADAGFIDLIYRDVLGRPPETEGRAFWISQLEAGRSRGAVMLAFSESPEFLRSTDSLPG